MSVPAWLRKRATIYEIDEIPGERGDWETDLIPLYVDLPCCDIPLAAEERAMHGSSGVDVSHLLVFPPYRRGIKVRIPEKAKIRVGEALYNVETVGVRGRPGMPPKFIQVLAREIR